MAVPEVSRSMSVKSVRRTRAANRIVVDKRNWGVSLAHAILLAQSGDTIVVHAEAQKALGEAMARMRQPNKRITFVVEPSEEAGEPSQRLGSDDRPDVNGLRHAG